MSRSHDVTKAILATYKPPKVVDYPKFESRYKAMEAEANDPSPLSARGMQTLFALSALSSGNRALISLGSNALSQLSGQEERGAQRAVDRAYDQERDTYDRDFGRASALEAAGIQDQNERRQAELAAAMQDQALAAQRDTEGLRAKASMTGNFAQGSRLRQMFVDNVAAVDTKYTKTQGVARKLVEIKSLVEELSREGLIGSTASAAWRRLSKDNFLRSDKRLQKLLSLKDEVGLPLATGNLDTQYSDRTLMEIKAAVGFEINKDPGAILERLDTAISLSARDVKTLRLQGASTIEEAALAAQQYGVDTTPILNESALWKDHQKNQKLKGVDSKRVEAAKAFRPAIPGMLISPPGEQ